jgi:hypothetical protein
MKVDLSKEDVYLLITALNDHLHRVNTRFLLTHKGADFDAMKRDPRAISLACLNTRLNAAIGVKL